ncbi:glycosyltransferase family 2 protein [Ancylomarina sp. DW003]|nr:glycosyltransferase family 2 protein [Ancylomarina sp. DW003]MDE5423410.1 glycosyltransferase family 2 protein [Ancylomarina sp. DW003]
MDQPLVSIITPVYNSSLFLKDTAESVFCQGYKNWEWILIDDKSTDDSWHVLSELSREDDRVKIFCNEVNSGSGITRNNAIRKAKGKYIAFLDSDDIWHSKKLEKHIAFMIEKKALFSHTSYGYLDEKGNVIKNTFRISKNPVSYKDLLKRTEISCLTAIYDAEILGKFYMSEHRRKQDYALWLSILKTGTKSYGLDEELAFYRQRVGSATSNKFKLVGKHFLFLKETQRMRTHQAIKYTVLWMINGFVRYYL